MEGEGSEGFRVFEKELFEDIEIRKHYYLLKLTNPDLFPSSGSSVDSSLAVEQVTQPQPVEPIIFTSPPASPAHQDGARVNRLNRCNVFSPLPEEDEGDGVMDVVIEQSAVQVACPSVRSVSDDGLQVSAGKHKPGSKGKRKRDEGTRSPPLFPSGSLRASGDSVSSSAPVAAEVSKRAKPSGKKVGTEVTEVVAPAAVEAAGVAGSAAPATNNDEEVMESQDTPSGQPKRERFPPAIVIKDKSRWNKLSAEAARIGLSFRHARMAKKGLVLKTSSKEEYRGWEKLLINGYYSFDFEEDKNLRIVLKGLDVEVETDFVKEDLTARGYPVLRVHRMHRGRDKVPLACALIILKRSPKSKELFNESSVCGLAGVTFEKPHKNGQVPQCFNCQLFGHSSRNCKMDPACVKCAEVHESRACPRPKDCPLPPKCHNCGGVHTASYRGCPEAPKIQRTFKPNVWTSRQSQSQRDRLPVELSNRNEFPGLREKSQTVSKQANTGPKGAGKRGGGIPYNRVVAPAPGVGVSVSEPVVDLSRASVQSDGAAAADLNYLLKFVDLLDFDEVSVAAAELRAAQNQTDMAKIIFKHLNLFRTLKSLLKP